MTGQSQALTDEEYDHMAAVLHRFHSERAMNLEMLDGFFVALICSPDMVPPSEYLPEIWGGALADDQVFGGERGLQKFIDLIMRHWNCVAQTLHSEDVFVPLLFEDDNGIDHGNDWANGFARGIEMRRNGWSKLFDDTEHAGALVPILALAHERHPDPEMRPYKEPMGAERREQLIVGMTSPTGSWPWGSKHSTRTHPPLALSWATFNVRPTRMR